MRKILVKGVLMVAMLACGCGGNKVSMNEIPADQVDAKVKQRAYSLGDSLLGNMDGGFMAELDEKDATPAVRKAFTPQVQEDSYMEILRTFGHYESMTFHSAWRVKDPTHAMTVYRFKGKFSNGEPEVRLVLDDEGKLSGFWVKPWHDTLQ